MDQAGYPVSGFVLALFLRPAQPLQMVSELQKVKLPEST
jgi:hypothetical protein